MLALALLPTTAAHAAESDAVRTARTLFEAGRSHYDAGEYEAAVHYFELGYAASPEPLFLYNIARAATKLGHKEKAIDYFERYLAAAPKAPERGEVKRRIAELKSQAPPAEPAQPESPPTVEFPGEKAEPAADPNAPPAELPREPSQVTAPVELHTPVREPTAERHGVWHKWWFWPTVAVGAAGLGLGIGLGVGLSAQSAPSSHFGVFQF